MTQLITGKIRERITAPHYLSEFGLGLGLGHDREQSLQSGVALPPTPHPLTRSEGRVPIEMVGWRPLQRGWVGDNSKLRTKN